MRITNKVLICLVFIFSCSPLACALNFKIASYNVENLFDLTHQGEEYSEYIPNNLYAWNKTTFNAKLNNIAKLIKDLGADIIALQEIESLEALISLQHRLKEFNVDYPYIAIADTKPTIVKCALLSKFPIKSKQEIKVPAESARNILKVTLEIENMPLVLFINHWKSKHGPESMRIAYAKVLKNEIKKISPKTDFIILGDFNSNYNEYKTFIFSEKLNDTSGKTGINHILKTLKGQELVDEKILQAKDSSEYLYNLWLELNPQDRWSYIFFNEKNSPDSIILSSALYDNTGISYLDNSFNKFYPDYLFKENKIYRWQRSKKGKGKHLGQGYSDHLPVFAYFSTNRSFSKIISVSDNSIIDLKELPKEELVNINSANASELITIPGIGNVLAKRIIAGRPYHKIRDLLKIKGIGEKKLNKFMPYINLKENN